MPQKNSKILERIYRLISLRQRSEKEIRDYFRLKGKGVYSDLVIEDTIKRLKELRLLDDEKFAKDWIESRSRKKGIRVIKQELLQKGISREIIEEASRQQQAHIESGEGSSENETAEKLLERKLRSWKNLEPAKVKKKAYDFLMRRGFEYETIREIVEKAIQKEYN